MRMPGFTGEAVLYNRSQYYEVFGEHYYDQIGDPDSQRSASPYRERVGVRPVPTFPPTCSIAGKLRD